MRKHIIDSKYLESFEFSEVIICFDNVELTFLPIELGKVMPNENMTK